MTTTTSIKIFYFKEIPIKKTIKDKVVTNNSIFFKKYDYIEREIDATRIENVKELIERINVYAKNNKLDILQFETLYETKLDTNLERTYDSRFVDRFNYFTKFNFSKKETGCKVLFRKNE